MPSPAACTPPGRPLSAGAVPFRPAGRHHPSHPKGRPHHPAAGGPAPGGGGAGAVGSAAGGSRHRTFKLSPTAQMDAQLAAKQKEMADLKAKIEAAQAAKKAAAAREAAAAAAGARQAALEQERRQRAQAAAELRERQQRLNGAFSAVFAVAAERDEEVAAEGAKAAAAEAEERRAGDEAAEITRVLAAKSDHEVGGVGRNSSSRTDARPQRRAAGQRTSLCALLCARLAARNASAAHAHLPNQPPHLSTRPPRPSVCSTAAAPQHSSAATASWSWCCTPTRAVRRGRRKRSSA